MAKFHAHRLRRPPPQRVPAPSTTSSEHAPASRLFANGAEGWSSIADHDVLHLQRTIGNRATTDLLNKKPAATIQRNVMPVEVWKSTSSLTFSRRSAQLKGVDDALNAYHSESHSAAKFVALKHLQDAIFTYERERGEGSGRKAALDVLKKQIRKELKSGGPQFQLWSIAQFTQATSEAGKVYGTAGLSGFQKEIIEMLGRFHSLTDPSGDDLNTSIGLLYEIRDYTDYWFEQYDARKNKNRENRAAGMQQFRDHLKGLMPAVESLVQVSAPFTPAPPQGRPRSGAPQPLPPQNEAQQQEREEKVQHIRDSHVGSAKSLFAKVGGFMVKAVAGEAGSKAEIDFEFKLPVEPSGVAFLGGHINLKAESEKTSTKLRGEISVTGGAKVPKIAEVKAELGGYFETQAQDPEKAMKLVSYAFYRKLRTSSVMPREVANYIWGGRTSALGYKIAERWAFNVEKQVFGGEGGDDSYIETGVFGAVSGSVGNEETAKLGGKVKAMNGSKYNKASIEKKKKIGQSLDVPGVRGKTQDDLSAPTAGIEVSLEGNVGPLSGDVTLLISGGEQSAFKVELEFNGKITVPGATEVMKLLAPNIELIVKKGVDYLRAYAKTRRGAVKPLAAGDGIGLVMQAPTWKKYAKHGVESLKPDPKSKVQSSKGVGVNLKLSYDDAKGVAGQLNLEWVGETKVDASTVTLKYTAKKRIVGLHYDKNSGWHLA